MKKSIYELTMQDGKKFFVIARDGMAAVQVLRLHFLTNSWFFERNGISIERIEDDFMTIYYGQLVSAKEIVKRFTQPMVLHEESNSAKKRF